MKRHTEVRQEQKQNNFPSTPFTRVIELGNWRNYLFI